MYPRGCVAALTVWHAKLHTVKLSVDRRSDHDICQAALRVQLKGLEQTVGMGR